MQPKCECYWPVDQIPVYYGDLQLQLEDIEQMGFFAIRNIAVSLVCYEMLLLYNYVHTHTQVHTSTCVHSFTYLYIIIRVLQRNSLFKKVKLDI